MARQQILACEDFRQRFGALLHNELDVEWRGRVKGHLLSCQACALAFGDVIAEAQAQHPVEAVHAMSRPPRAVLEAMEVQDHDGGSRWTALRTLAARGIEWAQREWAGVRDDLQANLQLWALAQQIRTHVEYVPVVGKIPVWPEHVAVKVVDPASQQQERVVLFDIVIPPTVTKNGHFLLTLHTKERGLIGGTLLCRVEAAEGVLVTFEGKLQHAANNQDLQVLITVEDLPACDGDVVIPMEQIRLSLLGSERNAF